MNKCYFSQWNAALGTWVAVPETSRRAGRKSSSSRLLATVAALLCAAPLLAQAQADTTISPGQTLYVTDPANVTGNLIINGGTLRGGVTLPNNVQVNGGFVIDPLDQYSAPAAPENGMTWSGNVRLSNTPAISFNSPPSSITYLLAMSGVVSGDSGLTINSPHPQPWWGNLDFIGTQSNTYTGTTTLLGNTVLSLRRTNGAISVPGNLNVAGTSTVAIGTSEQIADNATVIVESQGEFRQGFNAVLPGMLFYAPSLTETIGRLEGNGTIGLGSSTLVIGAGFFSGLISDPAVVNPRDGVSSGTGGRIVKDRDGTLTLSGANTYSGGTTLNAGTLLANHNQALGTGAITLNGGTLGTGIAGTQLANNLVVNNSFNVQGVFGLSGNVQLNATPTVTGVGTNGTVTLSGPISGNHGITYDSSATGVFQYSLTGSANNTYTGPTGAQGSAVINLRRTGAVSVPGNLNVSGTAAVGVLTSEQIGDNATLTINSPGQTNSATGSPIHVDGLVLGTWLGPVTETIGTLNGSGTIGLGSGTLRVGAGQFSGRLSDGAFATAMAAGGQGTLGGNLDKYGPGTLTLSGTNTYTGATTVSAGTLRAGAANTFSAASAHTVASAATLDLAGHSQTVASVNNRGTVSLLGATPGTTLTVNGNWVGNGGTLRLGTALGDSSSATDRLILNGAGASASGNTNVQVTNLGGLGALTAGNGIEVVSALNGATTTAQTTRSAFSLLGGYVGAGAYEYRLYAGDAAGAGENWYLRSAIVLPPVNPGTPANPTAPTNPATPETPASPGMPTESPEAPTGTGALPQSSGLVIPTYRVEVPLYAALPEQFRQSNLAMLGNMHQRVGDESGGAPGAGPNRGEERQAWGRIISVDRDIRQGGAVAPASRGRLSGFQAGTDLWANSQWRTGLYVGQLEGGMRVRGFARGLANYAVGSNDLRSQYLGGYATWKNDSGLYLDGVLQAGRHRYTATPTLSAGTSGKGSSLLASIEAGKAFSLSPDWVIEPQLQLVHQRISLDDASIAGALIRQDSHSGWLARAGVRVRGEVSTGAGVIQPYARFNVYKRSSGTDIAQFMSPAAITDIATRTGGTSSELAAGATWQLSPRTSVYGEVGKMWDAGGSTRTKSGVNGSLGVKVRW